MKRVLHVIDSLDLGGAQTFLLGLCSHLDRTYYLPEVACMHGRGVYAEAFEEAGIPVHSLSRGKFPPAYLPNFWRLMCREKYDILHFHLFGANLCAKPLALLKGHPSIIVHDQCNDASRDHNPLLLGMDALWNSFSGRVIAVSKSTRRYLLDREDLPDDRVSVIPNGIDTDAFHPATPEEKIAARRALNIPEDVVVIGGVGRLADQKNFPLFLETAAQITASHSPLQGNILFVIAGTGPMEATLRSEALRLGIGDRVLFLGHVSERAALYHALDGLLMTSRFEGTPMVLLEAMASALPVVASAVDGIAEVCTHGVDSLLIHDGRSSTFARSLRALIEDPDLAGKLGSRARTTVVSQYSIAGIAHRVEAVYQELLESLR